MINQNGGATTLLIVVCSLIQLALVIAGDSQSNINSESTIVADINDKYLLSTRDEKKSLSERWIKWNRVEWRKSDDEDDNKWIDHSSTSIIHERLDPTMNVAGNNDKKYVYSIHTSKIIIKYENCNFLSVICSGNIFVSRKIEVMSLFNLFKT